MASANQVTGLLVDWRNGNESAFDSLFAVALVHEVYLKLVKKSDSPLQNPVSTDVHDAVERSFNEPKKK